MREMTIDVQRHSNGGRVIYEYYWCETCNTGVGFLGIAMSIFKKTHKHPVVYHWIDEKGKVH